MKRECHQCGNEVEIPSQIDKNVPRKVTCSNCGATAELKTRKRNGRVKGLKGIFIREEKKPLSEKICF